MKGPLHPGSPPPGGFRKTGNSEKYIFKEAKIERICKKNICAKLPAASWWRYVYNRTLPCRCLQTSTFIKHMKFGADGTWYV